MLTEKLMEIEREFGNLEREMANPEIFSNPGEYTQINRRYAELAPIVRLWHEYKACETEIEQAQDLLNDPEMWELAKSDLEHNAKRKAEIEKELDMLLLPKDPRDERNVILEIRSGAGGDEAGRRYIGDVASFLRQQLGERTRHDVALIVEDDDRSLGPRPRHDLVGAQSACVGETRHRGGMIAPDPALAPTAPRRHENMGGTAFAHVGGIHRTFAEDLDIAELRELMRAIVTNPDPFAQARQL